MGAEWCRWVMFSYASARAIVCAVAVRTQFLAQIIGDGGARIAVVVVVVLSAYFLSHSQSINNVDFALAPAITIIIITHARTHTHDAAQHLNMCAIFVERLFLALLFRVAHDDLPFCACTHSSRLVDRRACASRGWLEGAVKL